MTPAPALAAALLWLHTAAHGADIRGEAPILDAVDRLVREDAKQWCRERGVSYPPDAVVLRVFKKERELEIWAKNAGQKRMTLVRTLPICAMDFEPGPKLAEGDAKTPEGFYRSEFLYGSSHWWMWMDLDPARVDAPGEAGKGSSFKMCLDYPNALDRLRTKQAGRGGKTGGEICLHGNCVSIGCASLKNRDYLPVFAFARHHDARRFGKLQVHIFPFRFEGMSPADRAAAARAWTHSEAVAPANLQRFWDNLREGYDAFRADPNPLRVRAGRTRYEFD